MCRNDCEVAFQLKLAQDGIGLVRESQMQMVAGNYVGFAGITSKSLMVQGSDGYTDPQKRSRVGMTSAGLCANFRDRRWSSKEEK
jgi:hypothetical protein